MSAEPSTRQSRAWLVPFILGVLLSLNMLFLILFGGSPEQFEIDTGVPLDELASAYPSVAIFITLQERLMLSVYLGFSLLIAAIAYVPFRRGEKWAWYAMWALPGVLIATTFLFFAGDQAGIGLFYGGVAAIALFGMFLAARAFFRSGSA